MPGEQLPLSIPSEPGHRLPARIEPMQPSPAGAPFDDPAFLFEPYWPGVRALVFGEGGGVRLQVEGLADAAAAFPELVRELPSQLDDDGVVLDGTLVVLDADGRLDPGLLRGRLAGASRAGRPAFVAADLLWSDGEPWIRRRYEVRRTRLETVLRDGDRCVVGRALPGEGTLLAEALPTLGIATLGARRLDGRYRPGAAGGAWLKIPIAVELTTARPDLALIQRLPLEGADPG